MSKSDGSTADYYTLPKGCAELQDLISYRNLNAQDGEMFRAIYRKGRASHSDELRDAKKVLFYAQAEVKRLEALQGATALGDFGQQNMLTPTVKESLTVGSSHSIPKWATHELTNRTRKSTGVYARFQDGQYLSERGRIYNMRRWAVVSQKFTPEQHTLTPADWPDENGPRNQRIHQNGELGEAIYAAVHGHKA